MLLKHIFYRASDIKPTFIRLILSLFMAATLASCSTPIKPSDNSQTSSAIQEPDSLNSLMQLAKQVEKKSAPSRATQLIDIAQRLFSIGEHQQAKKIISSINKSSLNNSAYADYSLTASDIFLAEQSLFTTKSLLSDSKLIQLLDDLSIEQQQRFHSNRAVLFDQIGDVLISLNEHIALGTLLSSNAHINDNNNAIWQQLSQLSHKELITLNTSNNDPILQGWLELATLSKQPQYSLQSQNAAILQWVGTHPNHPASQHLPSDLALLQALIDTPAKHIALLLPLQGKLAKAGQAIRDGFLAAYFTHQHAQQHTQHNTDPVLAQDNNPAVVFYDTSTEDIHTLYDNAVLNGADIVIGPLSKANVSALYEKSTLSTPVLALNYIDTYTQENSAPDKPIYQFGLSLEDEAVQVADRAWLEGHRQALVLSSEAKWGQRAATAFMNRWKEYGGTIVLKRTLKEAGSYSKTIETMLDIDKSHQRSTTLKRLFGRGFEFEPRRRADIDMIFLAARSQEGRQVKPTLNFHYATNIPVYSTSQIYSSTNSSNKNSDLNDIRLTTSPWALKTDIPEKQLITEHLMINPAYEQLYALGVDSFSLYPQLKQLHQLNDQQLSGTTGQLSIDQNKRVLRKQLWGRIHRGQLESLRTLTLSSEKAL
jgi:outer membrane PBP1 activator LpoA protein